MVRGEPYWQAGHPSLATCELLKGAAEQLESKQWLSTRKGRFHHEPLRAGLTLTLELTVATQPGVTAHSSECGLLRGAVRAYVFRSQMRTRFSANWEVARGGVMVSTALLNTP